jgi:hypothetical protein
MASHGKSAFIIAIVVVAALSGLALFVNQGGRALAQLGTLEAQAAKARQAEARAQEAAAALARQAQIAKEAQAATEAQAKADAAIAAAKRGEAVALDLSNYVTMKAERFANTQHAWATVPHGSQTFAGVPVEIQGATFLWGQRNADRGMKYAESIGGIPCKQKFAVLYLVHGTFYEGASGEPSFEVVLNYAGGEKQTDVILCGEDSRDWYVKAGEKMLGPTAKRSTLAWTGTGKSGQRDQDIRFCLTAIENKHPDRLVETIDLVSAKKQTAGCILAITVGKAGLLKPLTGKESGGSQPEIKLPASP